MHWLEEEAGIRKKAADEDDPNTLRMKKIERFLDQVHLDVSQVKLNVAVCTSSLKQVNRGDDALRGSRQGSKAGSRRNSKGEPATSAGAALLRSGSKDFYQSEGSKAGWQGFNNHSDAHSVDPSNLDGLRKVLDNHSWQLQ